jgi:hypothetical protein
MDRAASTVAGDPPALNGEEAVAELNKPRLHNPLAAAYISWFFPSLFILQLEHKGIRLSGRYRTLTLPF